MNAPVLIDGRYQVRRPLGSGAQGEVYEVLDTFEDAIVALKLLGPLSPGRGPWDEARVLRALEDDHILRIRNADVANGRPYIVTELARHGTLESLVAEAGPRGLEVEAVVTWIRQACLGVARAHDVRLLHNDIKPGNLFLTVRRECLVGDFGFCALLPEGASTTSPAGATVMTAAPEIAAEWPSPTTAGFRSDVYSLGATAYWLLAGRTPNDFTNATDEAAAWAIVAVESPPRLGDVAPHIPPFVARAIERAMARNVGERYPAVTDFAEELGRRPQPPRIWSRTDEHDGHLACWRGVSRGRPGAYLLCAVAGDRRSRVELIASQSVSGRRINSGCRNTTVRGMAQAVRSAIRSLG